MIEDLQALVADGYYDAADRQPPWIMRHSQGDHWDLMLLEPVTRYSDFFAEARLIAADNAPSTHNQRLTALGSRTAFREELFAYGPSPSVLGQDFETAGLYHIEMFRALPGLKTTLIEQREMENAYLADTSQVSNFIFTGDMGSDFDVFTIGTHDNLESFAASPDLPAETFAQAAVDAGFESRSTIGFYLRSLITSHNDTLATPVR